MFGNECCAKLLAEYDFRTVLDVGAGTGDATKAFRLAGKDVTSTDLSTDGTYTLTRFAAPFDLVWCSHTLEHAPCVQAFVRKLADDCREGGILAITVPPLKHEIVGGHVNLFNAGLLTYRLCLAGLDCSDIRLHKYGYNISAILTKRSVQLPKLIWDSGDIDTLQPFLPAFLHNNAFGDIPSWNW
jgi:SAM-dependent methyltransferase